MDSIKKYFDIKFKALKRELEKDVDEGIESKKPKTESVDFKYKSNKKQFEFN